MKDIYEIIIKENGKSIIKQKKISPKDLEDSFNEFKRKYN